MADIPAAKRKKISEPPASLSTALTPEPSLSDDFSCKEAVVDCDEEIGAERSFYLLENDVGISKYLSSHKGVSAILKQRFSDFHVHEISRSGEVAVLQDLASPNEDFAELEENSPDQSLLDPSDVEKLRGIVKSEDSKDFHVMPAEDSKEKRTEIHKAIKQIFPQLTSTTCKREDGKHEIKVMKSKFADDKRKKSKWPKDRGNYCKFVLYKENRDTMAAISVISKMIRNGTGCYHYAGTKDKRAITSQFVTAFRVKAARLAALNDGLQNIKLGNFSYVDEALKLGYLQGNSFTIVLRSVKGSTEEIETSVTSLRDYGFINYFGMQRFGSGNIPTYQIGKCLLQCDWAGAVDLILKPREGEHPDVTAARQIWVDTRDPEKALQAFPKYRNVEIYLLTGLKRFGPTNCLNAIQHIPRNSRLLYAHSYQSYVWNRIVSQRLEEFGMDLVEGDLVKKRAAIFPVREFADLEYITEENKTAYTIYDLVLPLPGYDVVYPKNKAAEWYYKMMSEDGIDLGQLRNKIKDFSLPGGYRCVYVRPKSLEWTVEAYEDFTVPLVSSDLEQLQNKHTEVTISKGSEQALILKFSLPSSSYATMAIREITKMDTSTFHQKTLNNI